MKKTKYKIHNMQYKQGFTVQLTTSNREHERKEETAAKDSLFIYLFIYLFIQFISPQLERVKTSTK